MPNAAINPQPALRVRDLHVRFEADGGSVAAVEGVSFDILPGRTFGIVGESGCGKSVTARAILRILDRGGRIARGEILLRRGDHVLDLAKLDPGGRQICSVRWREIALIFQEPMTSFSPVHTIGSQIIEAIRLHSDLSRNDARKLAIDQLDQVGTPHPAHIMSQYAWELSGGLCQRAMIAMALVCGPSVLIADEPTTALDVNTQAQVLALLRSLQVQRGMSLILITHDLGVVAEVADEVAVMYYGAIVEQGPVDAIFHAPKHPYTQALLRAMPNIMAKPRTHLATIPGMVPRAVDRAPGCAFRERCPNAIPGLCDSATPSPAFVGTDHKVACHLYGEHRAPLSPAGLEIGRRMNKASPVVAKPSSPVMPEDVLLRVQNLHKHFGGSRDGTGLVRAVENVSFDIRSGETLALVGESGCGKTTTARCIVRAAAATAGHIWFRGVDKEFVDVAALTGRQLRPFRSQMQMVFQDPFSSLNPRMTVLEIIAEPLKIHGLRDRETLRRRVAELLVTVGLPSEQMHQYPNAFSGGQRQRIGIARALALGPRLIVADEAVSALDVSVQAQILNLLLDLQEQFGLSYLFVAHDLSVVKHIADQVGVMYVGQLVELAPCEVLFEKPLHPYTAALLAAVPKPDPRLRDTRRPAPGEVASPRNPPSGCYFHPRCEFAVERCRVSAPEWTAMQDGRFVRCHRARELNLVGIHGSRSK